MSQGSHPAPPIFSQLDVSAGNHSDLIAGTQLEQSELLREVLAAQDRTNEILEELVGVMSHNQRQRSQELHQWRKANPHLAESCREAAESLSKVQVEYLNRITEEIHDSSEDMVDGDFMLNEFVDRFGPRLAHLNSVIQVLAQLSSVPTAAPTQES
jgi:hypothetical protein